MKAIAEAPSKVIITGEHFVVHGAWALAAALPKRVRVEVKESNAFSVTSDKFGGGRPELRPVGSAVEAIAREFSFNQRLRVSIKSQVPHGAGLGSSASTMVAVVAAVAKLHSLRLSLDEIVRLSMVGEEEIHGKPSGIDPTVCAKGGVILFKVGSRPRNLKFTGKRSLLVAFSGKSRSTKTQIAHVADVKQRFPSLFAGLAKSVSELSLTAAERLEVGDMPGLGELLNINHSVLSSLGISTPRLDNAADLSLSLGAYGAKLTGAGGGGSAVAVAPEGKQKKIISGLKARGFETFVARVPVEGVKSWLER